MYGVVGAWTQAKSFAWATSLVVCGVFCEISVDHYLRWRGRMWLAVPLGLARPNLRRQSDFEEALIRTSVP